MYVSLIDDGTGIFRTHVSLQDVNESISEQMDTQFQLTEETEFVEIGMGNGYSSHVLLVNPTWTVTDDTLPNEFVLKIICARQMKALVEGSKRPMPIEEKERIAAHFEKNARRLHNQEIEFYRVVENLGIGSRLLTPKVYFSKNFDDENKTKGFVGMEIVKETKAKHVNENVSPESLRPILRAIAVLQAKSSLLREEEKQIIGTTMFEETMRPMLEHGMGGLFEFLKRMDDGRLNEKVGKVEQFGKELVDFEKVFHLNERVGIHDGVLCHGDLWGSNILWNSDNLPVRIIDFQIVHLGNPAEDMVRLFISMLSGVDRRKYYERLLDVFYGFYIEALEGEKPFYTLEQLKESYRQFFVVGALTLLPMFGPVVKGVLESFSDEVRIGNQKIVSDNLECLLEDIETFHLLSKN